MPYEVNVKKGIGNQIGFKKFTVQNLTITNNCIQKGNKLLPITNVLFIEEVT